MINILQLECAIQLLRWSPHAESVLLAVADKSNKIYSVNYKTGSQKLIEMANVITTVIWHPRMSGHCLFGFDKGLVILLDMLT